MVKIGPEARRKEIDRKNREALEAKLKNRVLCVFYGRDRSMVTALLMVFTDKKRDGHVLGKYVRHKGMRYYLNMETGHGRSFYTWYPPDQRIQVQVLCAYFFENWQEELDANKMITTVKPT